MENEDEDVLSLLHLREHRKAFVRMVSWEIGNKSQGLQNRMKSKNSDSETDSETSDIDIDWDSDSSEGEYFSAEETIETNMDKLVANNKSKEKTGMEVLLDESSMEVHVPKPEHHRALSKRQKRRKRERIREDMMLAIPFRNVENLDFDCLNLEDELEVPVQRKLPSLVERCMKTLWKFNLVGSGGTSVSRQTDLPAVMQRELFLWRSTQHRATSQLTWLYRLLGHGEEFLNRPYSCYLKELKQVSDMEGASDFVLERATRTVWNHKVLGYEESQNLMVYNGTEASAWLPYTYMNNSEYGAFWNDNAYQWKYPTQLLSGVSSVLDLMLPQGGVLPHTAMAKSAISTKSTKSDKCVKSTTSCMAIENKRTVAHLRQIEESLSQRYPQVVKYVVKEAVPYTLWARGDIGLALQHFLSLSKQASGYRRAMYLSEGARLCAFVGETEMARDFYKESAEALIGRVKGGNQDEQEVKTQRFLLMTNLYDQGPMTEEKGEKASSSWSATLQHTTTAQHSTILRAVESHFCFHSGTNGRQDVDMVRHLSEGLCWIKSLRGQCPALLQHQVVLEAWLGQTTDAYTSLRRTRTDAMWSCGEEVNIFVMAWVKAVPPPPLRVVWRTQLGHMRLVLGQQCYEADFIAQSNLHLHLTADGFLSGDLQMLLPPIRAIHLDPYTGVPVFKPLSGVPEPWHSLNFCSLFFSELPKYNGGFVAPTLVQLYQDESGNSVHFSCKTIATVVTDIPLHSLTFVWTTADGNRRKLDLFPKLRKKVRDERVSYLESTRDPCVNQFVEGNEEWVSMMTQALDVCYKKFLPMGNDTLRSVHRSLKKIKKYVKEVKNSNSEKKRKASVKLEDAKTAFQSLCSDRFGVDIVEYLVFGKTLFLLLTCDHCTGVAVMFDCSTLEAFMHPKIKVFENFVREHQQGETISRQRNNCIIHGQVMWIVLESTRNDRCRLLHVYGQGGRLLMEKQLSLSEKIQTPIVHGTMLYGISPDRHSVLCDQLTGDDPITGCLVDWYIVDLLVLPSVLLVHSRGGLHILCPSSLQLKLIKVTSNRFSLAVSSDQKMIEAPNLGRVQIIGETALSDTGDDGNSRFLTAVAADNHLLLFQGQEAEVCQCIAVPGHAKDFCWVHNKVGFLVSVSIQDSRQANYRETLYHYNNHGDLLAVLPFLGPGPRNMFPALLPGTQKDAVHDPLLRKRGWYVFLRDGHEGMMGIKLCDI
ncbi:uncharacterized protein LOC124262912 [Haliotis rubra]|uniref:uncharacterized protein LOC124262912 n=1 Tax=Haliotis rubra TaxID=36100 RepID=UPI001EE517FB|nr:uncharacterized protein LOC124262912 [Haliotis rubra]XP_046553465.1 uncharacterized protein LOC124262912 [Haliotis rubra]XP_046553466.1 uncharacterized protein LOC124262912 [Haliotis rubra]